MSDNKNNISEKSFEENMERLKEIVNALEGGKETLENSIELFKEGRELVKVCEEKLKNAKFKITQITEEEM